MRLKRQMDPNDIDEVQNNIQLLNVDDLNRPSGGSLNGGSQANPDSGSLTTTPFPRLTVFNDGRDRALRQQINLALPSLNDIINLYVSLFNLISKN